MSNDNNLWTISRSFNKAELPGNIRTLLFCGNGFLGVQASLPGDTPSGSFINGFFETAPIVYGEKAFGYPDQQQVMIPLADILGWTLYETDSNRPEPRKETPCPIVKGRIELDMKRGIRTLFSRIRTNSGNDIDLKEEVLVSLTQPGILLSRISITGEGNFRLKRRIAAPGGSEESHDPRKAEAFGHEVFAESRLKNQGANLQLQETTCNSKLSYNCFLGLAEGFEKTTGSEASSQWKDQSEYEYDCPLSQNGDERNSLMAALFSTGEVPDTIQLDTALNEGWQKMAAEQEEYLKAFWLKADMVFEKQPELTRAQRYCSYGPYPVSRNQCRTKRRRQGAEQCWLQRPLLLGCGHLCPGCFEYAGTAKSQGSCGVQDIQTAGRQRKGG